MNLADINSPAELVLENEKEDGVRSENRQDDRWCLCLSRVGRQQRCGQVSNDQRTGRDGCSQKENK